MIGRIKSVRYRMLILGIAALLLTACEKTVEEPDITVNNLKGMFVVCEGVYGSANGDITFYDSESDQSTKSLYFSVNNVELGDVVQSFEIVDTLGFIVVNNSQKVTVVNMKDFKVVKTIDGFSYPRSVVRADDNTVYVSNGNGSSENYIYSIDLFLLEKSDSLQVASGPEKLIKVNSKIYGAISGGWNNDGNTVIEIDPSTFAILHTYEVASVPVDIVADKDNNIWAYCKGVPDYANWPDVTYTNSGITKINVSTRAVTTLPLSKISSPGINNIAVNPGGNIIYYLNDGLYSMPVSSTVLPDSKVVDRLFYGMDVDPVSGHIVCLDEINSEAVIYDINGVEEMSFNTAPYPNSVVFSY
ncbi:MAG: YncE family protein [Bacteroidota bacterium]